MTTTVENLFLINGVVDTSKTVLQNIQTLCSAAGAWLTYDINQGAWAVVINRDGTSVASFDDTNIIGGINVSGTGLNELYNSVEIQFPHKDIKDRTDYIRFVTPTGDRFPNEQDNQLSIQLDCVNDPIQAAYLASRELKQSRVDKVIELRTDFTSLGLKAGDLIDITSSVYGYSGSLFRIIRITEEDGDDGSLQLSIQALEYNADVYSTSGLTREDRFTDTGIVTKSANTAVVSSDQASTSNSLTNGLLGLGGAALVSALLNALTRSSGGGGVRVNSNGIAPVCDVFEVNQLAITSDTATHIYDLGRSVVLPYSGRYKVFYNINWGANLSTSPPLGVLKNSAILIQLNGATVGLGNWAATGDQHVQMYEDHAITGLFTGQAGQVLSYGFTASCNLDPAYYTVPSGYPSYTVPTGAQAYVWIIAEVTYLGT